MTMEEGEGAALHGGSADLHEASAPRMIRGRNIRPLVARPSSYRLWLPRSPRQFPPCQLDLSPNQSHAAIASLPYQDRAPGRHMRLRGDLQPSRSILYHPVIAELAWFF